MTETVLLNLADLAPGTYRERLGGVVGPQTRVTVSCAGCARLPVAFLAAALELTAERHGFVFLDGLGAAPRLAVELVDATGVLGLTGGPRSAQRPGDPAFAVLLDHQDGVRVRTLKGVGQHPQLGDPAAHLWMKGLAARSLTIDLAVVEHINSLLVAWLLQLSQAAAPIKVELLNVSNQTSVQLGQLRLDHLLTWGDGSRPSPQERTSGAAPSKPGK